MKTDRNWLDNNSEYLSGSEIMKYWKDLDKISDRGSQWFHFAHPTPDVVESTRRRFLFLGMMFLRYLQPFVNFSFFNSAVGLSCS